MSALMFPADPFDAWDEHDFHLWVARDRSAKLRGQIVGMIDHQHEIDALSHMFAAKSWAREMMEQYAKFMGAKFEKIGETGAVRVWWDELEGEMRTEHLAAPEFYGIDFGTEIAMWYGSDGLYRGPDIATFEIVPEPMPDFPTPKRTKDPFNTHPRSPRGTMRARRGR